MNKNQFFDMKLYKEGIRQLRIPGIVSGVILILSGVLVPLMYLIDIYSRYQPNIGSETEVFETVELSLLAVNGMLWICPYILAALMTIMLFRFLNQRNSSDFYHSLPQTRICVAVSFLAAVFTWVLGLLLGIGLLSCLFAEALPFITVDWADVFYSMLRLATGSILAVGGTFLAVTMTGTIFTNFAVAVMILCVPTLLSLVMEFNIVEKLYFVQSVEEMMLYQHNNLVNIVGEIFWGRTSGNSIFSAVYTTLLGLVYSVLGVFVYQRRSSESAGQSACSRWLKAVFRVVPAFVLSLISISMIYQDTIYSASELFLVIVIYIVAVMVYFLYELFSTGKWKNALISLKGLWLLAVLNLAVLLVLNGVTLYAKNCIPKGEEIVSVRLLEDGYDYYESQLSELELEDKDIREFVSEALEDTVKKGEDGAYWDYEARKTVAIQTKWGTLYRYLYITYEQQQELIRMLEATDGYRNIYMTIPNLKEWKMYGSQTWKDEGSIERIYHTLEEEIQEMGFQEWYNYVNNNSQDSWIYLDFDRENGNGYFSLPITIDLPETYYQCVQEIRIETDGKQYDKVSELFAKISRQEAESDIWFSVIDVYGGRAVGENWIYTVIGEEIGDEAEPVFEKSWDGVQTEMVEAEVYVPEETYDYSVYCAYVLSQIFAREPMEEGSILLNINGDVYDGKTWHSLSDTWVYITAEELESLSKADLYY